MSKKAAQEKYWAARVFAVKIDAVEQDFVQVYSFGMRGIIADTKGAKKFKRVD